VEKSGLDLASIGYCHYASPSSLCLSQGSVQPKSLGWTESLAAQTRVDWIPVTGTGMRECMQKPPG